MKIPFKRILVALDRVNSADAVFEQASVLARQNNSHLILAHCISLKTLEQLGSIVDAGFGLVSWAKRRRLQDAHLAEVNQAWLWLSDYALRSQMHGIRTGVRCVVGEARIQICDLAREWNADLIVLGHGGRLSLTEKLFGSTTHHVVQHAPCSVIVVQPDQGVQRLSHWEARTHSTQSSSVQQQSMWNLHVPITNIQNAQYEIPASFCCQPTQAGWH